MFVHNCQPINNIPSIPCRPHRHIPNAPAHTSIHALPLHPGIGVSNPVLAIKCGSAPASSVFVGKGGREDGRWWEGHVDRDEEPWGMVYDIM